MAICVPARNEAAELPKLFDAIEHLDRDLAHAVHLCLLLDGCSDTSADLANSFRSRSAIPVWIEESPSTMSNAGRAPHRAMMLGLSALGQEGGLLLTTDADTVPAPNWLRAMTQALDLAEVVAGRIVRKVNRPNHLQDPVEAYYDALFALRRRLDPVYWEASATHHFSGGANIGIRSTAYQTVGGFLPLPSGEDARLIDDAARLGLRVRRDAESAVHTSDRRDGRATGGMAMALKHLDGGDAEMVTVAHPADAAWQYHLQGVARSAHEDDRLDIVGAAIGLSDDHVRGVARDCPNAEAFAMRIVPTPPGGMRYVTLAAAEAELGRLVGTRRAA